MPKESSKTDEPDTAAINTGGNVSQTIPPKEHTKAFLAKWFVMAVLTAIGFIPAILIWFGKIDLNGFKDIVLTLGSVFGGPVGIILNNYFKEGGEK